MDPRTVLRLGGALRTAMGAVLLAAPAAVGRPWVGEAAGEPAGQTLLRTLGARDLAIGGGTLAALAADAPVRGWALWAAVSDALDVAVALAGRDRLGSAAAPAVIALAGTAALGHAYAAARLD